MKMDSIRFSHFSKGHGWVGLKMNGVMHNNLSIQLYIDSVVLPGFYNTKPNSASSQPNPV